MTQQIIDIGSAPNDGTGDQLRVAFEKVNDNTTETYAAGPVGSDIQIANDTISNTTSSGIGNVSLLPSGSGEVILAGDARGTGTLDIAGTVSAADPNPSINAHLVTIGYFNANSGGASDAAGITTNTSNFDNNLSATDTNVQLALDTLDDLIVPAGTAVGTSVDASAFAGNLSATDTDVQTALGTIDALSLGGAGMTSFIVTDGGDSYTVTDGDSIRFADSDDPANIQISIDETPGSGGVNISLQDSILLSTVQASTVDVSGTFVISSTNVPVTETATGTAGQVAWDADYLYVCVATDSWKRVALAADTWSNV